MPPLKYADRTLTIYFPSKQEFEEVADAATKAKIPFSHFAREMILRGMERQTAPQPDLLRETSQDREELSRLRRALKDSAAARQKLETEIFTLRSSLFLQPIPEGQGKLSSELVELLQDGYVWRANDIMQELGIDPKNIDALKVLAGQLHALQDLKLVEEGPKGWRWIG